jgi:hypothetical protein
VDQTFPYARSDPARKIFFSLDNEPDLWNQTHARIQLIPLRYDTLAGKCVDFARAIKSVIPNAVVFGPVNYGWAGYESLQDAPDAGEKGNFIGYFLGRMQEAGTQYGGRLLDVLDVHWYPEARGDNVRIADDQGAQPSPGLVEARVQAPRSLWDPTYTEDSWITQWSTKGPIRLLPRLRDRISARYPGTELAITEYNYGGGAHISGGIAQADVLGIFGREKVFAACLWRLGANQDFIHGGFDVFRDFDGQGGRFADTHIQAITSDPASTSLYASVDASTPSKMVIVCLNKRTAALNVEIGIRHPIAFSRAKVFRLTASSPSPKAAPEIVLGGTTRFTYTMPAMSISVLAMDGPLSDVTAPGVTMGSLTFFLKASGPGGVEANSVIVGAAPATPLGAHLWRVSIPRASGVQVLPISATFPGGTQASSQIRIE